MAKSKKNTKETGTGLENIEASLSNAEQFIEKNQKKLLYVVAGIIIIVGGYLLYQKYVVEPHHQESVEVSYMAQQYFGVDSFNLALNGDESNLGFLAIIDEYGGTDIGNTANYYAGLCYLNLKQFNEAIEYLEEFDTEDPILGPMAKGNIGNAYAELANYNEALSYYMEAAELNINKLTTPMYLEKAALMKEMLGDKAGALQLYERINKEYFDTKYKISSDKYIAKLKTELNQ